MKINRLLLGLLVVALGASSCTEDQLTGRPSGDTVTEDQNEEVLEMLPERLRGLVNGMYAYFNQFNMTGQENHTEFGYPSSVISSELWGQDMVQTGSAYNWFWGDQIYTSRGYTLNDAYYQWAVYYKIANKANEVLRKVPADTEEPISVAYIGQARAVRAFCYWNLVQLYQHTYKGHEQAPAVPIVTENMTKAEAANNPRATVQKVYEFILEDLNAAVTDLEGYQRAAKYEVDQQVAYGLLARVYLTMELWDDAAQAAANASTGYTPMTGDEYLDPVTGFNDISNHAWMWGSDINETNEVVQTGIINYPSHLCSITYGYAVAGGMYKAISKKLYDAMKSTDIRKNAFASSNGIYYVGGVPTAMTAPYANVKFKPYKGVVYTDVNANDWPLMRVEEMKLIEAEGKAMGSDFLGGKQALEDFVKTYRDPSFVSAATTPEQLQEEIWLQRRLELWGEGFAWYDLKRLKKGTSRTYTGTNFLKAAQIDLPAEHGLFLLRIPLNEIQINAGIPESANNPIATPPAIN